MINPTKIVGFAKWAVLAAPALAMADEALIKDVDGLEAFIGRISLAFAGIIMLISVVMILWAAFNYMTAQGNTEKVESANKQIQWAVVGIIVAVLAWSIPAVVMSFIFEAADANPMTD